MGCHHPLGADDMMEITVLILNSLALSLLISYRVDPCNF